MRAPRPGLAVVLAGWLAVGAFPDVVVPAEPSAPIVRPIAVSGQSAPGGGTFDRFNVESLPVVAPITSRGEVAFFATIARGPAAEGFFLATGGRAVKVAAEGDPAPGGGTFSGFGRHPIPALSDSGQVAFVASVAGGRTVEGVFAGAPSRLRAVAVAGTSAPGVPTGTFASLDAPAINDRGDVAFLATVRRGRETLEAIYVARGGKLQKLVAQGDPSPAGGVFAGFGPPALNKTGAVAFAAVVEGRAVPGGIFVMGRERMRMLVGAGEATPAGGIFAKFSERVALNGAGVVAFNAVLKDAPTPGALFVAGGAVARKVVGIGDPAPGGGSFSHFGFWPAISDAGAIAFAASVDGAAGPIGVFVAEASGRVTKLAGIGDELPGGARLASFGLYPTVSMSPAGGVTFAIAPTATGEGGEGLYAAAPAPR